MLERVYICLIEEEEYLNRLKSFKYL